MKTTSENTVSNSNDGLYGRKYYESGNISWGMFMIFAGITLLLNTLHIVPWNVWSEIFTFWPLLLIISGIHIILGNNIFARLLLTLIAVIVFTVVFLSSIAKVAPGFVHSLPQEIQGLVIYFDNIKL